MNLYNELEHMTEDWPLQESLILFGIYLNENEVEGYRRGIRRRTDMNERTREFLIRDINYYRVIQPHIVKLQ